MKATLKTNNKERVSENQEKKTGIIYFTNKKILFLSYVLFTKGL